MVKAKDLINLQKDRENTKFITFDKIYTNIEKKICLASTSNQYYTWYQIPDILIGFPVYSRVECEKYVIEKLQKDGFTIEFFEPNILLIKWFPK